VDIKGNDRMIKLTALLESFSKDYLVKFKKSWIGTYVKNTETGEKHKVIDAKHYGSYQEFIIKVNGKKVTLSTAYGAYLRDGDMVDYTTI